MEEFYQPDIGLKNIGEVIGENTLKTDAGFPYSGIWCFTGQQGSGKTLLMMHCVKDIIEQYPKALIVSNINIYGVPSIPYKGVEDFEKYNNGADGIIFVIDEIHVLFNALESAGMPLSTMQVWAQNRKNRRLILGTTQRFNRVAKGVREQTTWNYECHRPILRLIYSYRVMDGANYDDRGNYIVEDEDDKPRRHFYIPSVHVMRMYNTLEVVRREEVRAEKKTAKENPPSQKELVGKLFGRSAFNGDNR